MGTTKLTRKEILAEDPVHGALIAFIDFLKVHGKKAGVLAVAVLLLAFGIYGGLQFLENREIQAQERIGRGIDFFNAQVAPDATDEPYAKGAVATFKSDAAKYQAAAKEFSWVSSRYGYSKVSSIARYYLGLTQLELGQKKEAVQNLESVASNSKNRPVAYLAKKVLASHYQNEGNYRAAEKILDGMIKDGQCDLPKEELSLQLSRVLVAQGKRDEAIKVLRAANAGQGSVFSSLKQQVVSELDKLQKTAMTGPGASSTHP